MSTTRTSAFSRHVLSSRLRIPLGIWLLALALGASEPVVAQSDDFNAGEDTASVAWTHYDALSTIFGAPPQDTWSFPGGNTYRLQASPSPAPDAVGPGRVGSFPTNVYTDFSVAVDVVGWDNSYSQAFGFLARAGDFGTPGSPSTRGYLFFYVNGAVSSVVYDNFIAIARLQNDAQTRGVPGSSGQTAELHGLTLDPAVPYRLLLMGKGTHLEGRVYQLPDLQHPIGLVSANTAGEPVQHSVGQCGLFAFDVADPAGNLFAGPVDVTFDNYSALADPPPTSSAEPRLVLNVISGTAVVSWPAGLDGIWVLETSPTLGPAASWSEVPAYQIAFAGGRRVYTESSWIVSNPSNYFRLRKL